MQEGRLRNISRSVETGVNMLSTLSDKLGISPENLLKNLQEYQSQEAKTFQSFAPLVGDMFSDNVEALPKLFAYFEERRRLKRSRPRDLDGRPGFDENKTVIALGKMSGLPDEIETPLSEEKRIEHLEKLQKKAFGLEEKLQKGSLTKRGLNNLIDMVIEDRIGNFMAELFDIPKRIQEKVKKDLKKILEESNLVTRSETFKKKMENWNPGSNRKKKKYGFWEWLIRAAFDKL